LLRPSGTSPPIAETNRHAGHADILRELIDGRVGLPAGHTNMPPGDSEWWQSYRQHLDDIAAQFHCSRRP
jgi:hypothetical protein